MAHVQIYGYDPAQQDAWYGSTAEKIPPGKHICEVVAVQEKATKAGDGRNLVFELQIVDSENESAVGRKYTYYLYLGKTRGTKEQNDLAWNRMKGFLAIFGIYGADFDTKEFLEKRFLGIFNDVADEVRQDNGEMVTKVFSKMVGYLLEDGSRPAMGANDNARGTGAANDDARTAATKKTTATVRHLGR